MSRGASAERQANLQLLASVQHETDAKRAELEIRYASMSVLSPDQAEQVVIRILAMSPDDLVKSFQDCRLRMAGQNPWRYLYGDRRGARHRGDREMAAAVERVNVAICAYDEAALDLRIAELFGGRVSWEESQPPRDESKRVDRGVFALDFFGVLVSIAKIDAHYQTLEGQDIRVLDSENLQEIMRDWPSFI